MKKEKAIDILQNQIEKVLKIDSNNCYVWKTQASSYIKTFFGESSEEFEYINEFKFDYHRLTGEAIPAGNIQPLKQFIENCIETIKNKGLYKAPKHNFLYRLSDGWLIAIITVAIPGIFYLGSLWGKSLSDTQNIELRQENKKLKSLTKDLPVYNDTNNVPNNKGDTQIN